MVKIRNRSGLPKALVCLLFLACVLNAALSASSAEAGRKKGKRANAAPAAETPAADETAKAAPEAAAPAAPANEAPAPAAEKIGRDMCLTCHDGYLSETVHGRLPKKIYEQGKMECEACHGPGSAHAEASGDTSLIRLRPAPDAVRSLCFACHPNDRAASGDWKRGVHNARGDMDCLTCHDFHHAKNAAQLRKKVDEGCLECHPNVKADFSRPYRHPLGAGGLSCVDCHDPHAERAGLSRQGEINENCVRCHSEVRGPFVWEHKALTEDKGCLNCHNAHGSSTRKLLKQAENALCLQCHQGVFSAGRAAAGFSKAAIEHARMPEYEGRCGLCHTMAPAFNPTAPGHYQKVPFRECANCHGDFNGIDHTKFLTRGRCLDCHTDIHGSNHHRGFLD